MTKTNSQHLHDVSFELLDDGAVKLTQMDRHHFLLARIAVSASFATRRIRVLLDVLAMFSSAFAAAMIASFSSARIRFSTGEARSGSCATSKYIC